MTPEQIGAIIQYHRRKAGLSRRALAELAGVGTTAIYDVEHGKPRGQLQIILALLKTLNITMRLESPFMDEYQAEAEL